MNSVMSKYSFEERLPKGWHLGKLYRGKRAIYYNDIKLGTVEDDFAIAQRVQEIIENPPKEVISSYVKEGKIQAACVKDAAAQKYLVKSEAVSVTQAYSLFPRLRAWLDRQKPSEVEFSGIRYHRKGTHWFTEDGSPLDTRKPYFNSNWSARMLYNSGRYSLFDIAQYSWSAFLECLGDEHQKLFNQIKSKAEEKKHLLATIHKIEREDKLKKTRREWISDDEFEEYKNLINSTLYDNLVSSAENASMMFKRNCLVSGFEWVKPAVDKFILSVVGQVSAIKPKLVSFSWSPLLQRYEPVYAPKRLSPDKLELLLDLIPKVMVGDMSGYEARLRFTNGWYRTIRYEQARFKKSMYQFVPYFAQLKKAGHKSFAETVDFVCNNIKTLISMGFREADRIRTAFVYDSCRFIVDVKSKVVKFIGFAGSRYISLEGKETSGESDEYVQKARAKFRQSLGYLQFCVHKGQSQWYVYEDVQKSKNKWLKHSPEFMSEINRRGATYINQYKKGVA